jgi:hypothetical protein
MHDGLQSLVIVVMVIVEAVGCFDLESVLFQSLAWVIRRLRRLLNMPMLMRTTDPRRRQGDTKQECEQRP